jgi:hypothetical protein
VVPHGLVVVDLFDAEVLLVQAARDHEIGHPAEPLAVPFVLGLRVVLARLEGEDALDGGDAADGEAAVAGECVRL